MRSDHPDRGWLLWTVGGITVIALVAGAVLTVRRHQQATITQAESATTFHGETGKTVLELLRDRATVETATEPQLGTFVTAINGVKSGTNGKYWIYTVNGQPSATSPDQYQTKASDEISWKFE